MKETYYHIILIIALIITLYGLITNKFIFMLLLFPFGLGLFKKNNDNSVMSRIVKVLSVNDIKEIAEIIYD